MMNRLVLSVGNERKSNFDTGALAASIDNFECAAMRFGDQRRQIQSETGATGMAGAGRVAAIEWLADMRRLFRRDSRAIVLDPKHEVALSLLNGHIDRPCRLRRITNGVA